MCLLALYSKKFFIQYQLIKLTKFAYIVFKNFLYSISINKIYKVCFSLSLKFLTSGGNLKQMPMYTVVLCWFY
mgnify:CR=1 FL=1